MKQSFLKSKWVYWVPTLIFVGFAVWWFYLSSLNIDITRNSRQIWGASYQILALYGAIAGLFISKKWGGYKSFMGRAILFFSIGLFLQVFGQSYSSYYVYRHGVESPPYPGIDDIGFFGSVIAYIYAAILLSRVSGVGASLKKMGNKIWVVVIPIIGVAISYYFFLQGYSFDWTNKVKILLDIGYPVGQALYVSIAVIALLMSYKFLGGAMKTPILFVIFALLFQYFSDFTFLYQSNLGNWYVGNINDFCYAMSYFIMAMALINLGAVYEKIKSS